MEDLAALVRDPLGFVDTHFNTHVSEGGDPTAFQVEETISQLVEQLEIPSLNHVRRDMLLPNSLVRFRCMVQDTFNPEFYLDTFVTSETEAPRFGRYRDSIPVEEGEQIIQEHPTNTFQGRHPLYCVPIPGESAWVHDTHAATAAAPPLVVDELDTTDAASVRKRGMGDLDEEDDEDDQADMAQAPSAKGEISVESAQSASSSKKHMAQAQSSEAPLLTFDLNLPIPVDSDAPNAALHVPAVVKMYSEDHGLKIHDAIEVIGVYTIDGNPAMPSNDPFNVQRAPQSMVPHIHCLTFRVLNTTNPLINNPFSETDATEFSSVATEIRPQLLATLSQLVYGDELAAEYLLLHLLSLSERKGYQLLGNLPLNLSNFRSADDVSALCGCISDLVAKSHVMQLGIDTLNTARLMPKKDYDHDRLLAGQLQLAKGTNLILDETTLNEGKLIDTGVKNMQALQQLISEQKIDFNFEPSPPISFSNQIPVLILSEGTSLFQTRIKLKLAPTAEVGVPDLSADTLNSFRAYIESARHMPYTITEDVQSAVAADFIAWRQADPSVNEDVLHLRLDLAKMHALSHGQTQLTADSWKAACALEEARAARA
eukprot:m.60249 g.60249  ORF g.60249 m.60249 type:complete len:598 (+) comp11803_c0_seq1:209-2002(+)